MSGIKNTIKRMELSMKESDNSLEKEINDLVKEKAVSLLVNDITDMLMAVENHANEMEIRLKIEKVNRGIWWESGNDKDLYWKMCYRLFVDNCGSYYVAAGTERDTHPKGTLPTKEEGLF